MFSSPVQKYRELLLSLDVSVGMGVKFYIKVFLIWVRHCQTSYPVLGQVLLPWEQIFSFLDPI